MAYAYETAGEKGKNQSAFGAGAGNVPVRRIPAGVCMPDKHKGNNVSRKINTSFGHGSEKR